MKNVLIFSFLTLISAVVHATSLSGVLTKKDGQFFLTPSQSEQAYSLVNTAAEASDALLKLETGDYITGSGVIDEVQHKIELQALDYVGLKKLLGRWYSGDSVMNFTTFSNLSVYPFMKNLLQPAIIGPVPLKTEFRYSTAPYYGGRWAVFLSDNGGNTIFATLEITGDSAVIRTVNTQTGTTIRTLRLVRWGE